jgi:hypothetical protein
MRGSKLLRHSSYMFAVLAALFAHWVRADEEPRLPDTTERLTAAQEKSIRRAFVQSGPAIGTVFKNGLAWRIVNVPAVIEKTYGKKPKATVRLLLKIVEGGQPWDSIHAVACIEALVESPEYASVGARAWEDKTWDDVIGEGNPLTQRELCRQVCVKLIIEKEKGKGDKKKR